MNIPPKLRKTFQVTFALTVTGLSIWGAIALVRVFWDAFVQLNPTIAAGILAAVATVLVSVVSVLYAKHLEQRIALRKEHRDKKIPIYEDLIAFIFRVMYSYKEGQSSIPTEELIETHAQLTQKAIIWASDDVLKAFYRFRLASLEADNNSLGLALAVEDLFLAIRLDLGHKNKDLLTGQLLRLFINDLHELV